MIGISAIIPCKNEEKHISSCIDALLKQDAPNLILEIIVVDNGSTDKTLEILHSYSSALQVYSMPGITISGLRNFGGSRARGEWFAFIDADVEIDAKWSVNLLRMLSNLSGSGVELSNVITGSTYVIPRKSVWVERVWYEHLKVRDSKSRRYINGGNLVIHRELFTKIGGFSPAYRTGEDEDLCSRAIASGANIYKENSIAAVHHGYPKSLWEFFKRERWHGLGMINNKSRLSGSRDLTLAIFFLIVSVFWVFSLVSKAPIFASTVGAFLLMVLPITIMAIARSTCNPAHFGPLLLLYFVYGWGRVAALFDLAITRVGEWIRNKSSNPSV